MSNNLISGLIKLINANQLHQNLFNLSKDPLPYRKLNYTVPGAGKNTLYQADDFIQKKLESWGYTVEKEGVEVRAVNSEESPWFTAYNLYAKKLGVVHPEEIILFLSHKDSQSWVDSPGAYDNCAGTVSTMEIARVLKDYPSQRSVWFLFCNEEHAPWTSVTAAQNAKLRNDDLIAIFNLDAVGGKSHADINADRKTNVTVFTEPEGERFADLMDEVNKIYQIGLTQRKHQRQSPGDDDGSFIKAGFPMAIMNIGSFPYTDPNYHLETDIPELVDIQNLWMSAQASLAAGLSVDLGEV
ncbi:TPA: M28 family peptidase [Candidatus Poribacteria bacterium]|nr:M28 family peptidase [Candidatus Poribacteria bacterium]